MTQAHFHTFAIPEGTVHLATSPLFPNQAFRYGDRTHGFHLHPEVTIKGFRRLQANDRAAHGKPGTQSRAEQDALMAQHDARQANWFYAFRRKRFVAATSPLWPTAIRRPSASF